MKKFLAILGLAACLPAAGQPRLVAELVDCPRAARAIGTDLALGVVDSLLGGAIDSLVKWLGSDQVATYSAILPVADVAAVFDGTACLQVRSAPAGTRDFNALLHFSTVNDALKAEVVGWHYPHDAEKSFLTERCRLWHSCQRRDVAFQLEVLPPASSFKDSSVAATPLQMAFADATAQEVHDAFNGRAPAVVLPWTRRPELKGAANLRFLLVETMQASAFAKAMSSSLQSQKGAILARVRAQLDGTADAVAAQAALRDIEAATTAQAEYLAAWRAAKASQQAHAAQAGNPQEQAVLRAAYALQVATVKARRSIAEQAYKVAGIAWNDGLEALPDRL